MTKQRAESGLMQVHPGDFHVQFSYTHTRQVKNTPVGTIGVTICYDLRFPELYTALRAAGAEVILVPSAFMPTTGEAHWEVCVRLRKPLQTMDIFILDIFGEHRAGLTCSSAVRSTCSSAVRSTCSSAVRSTCSSAVRSTCSSAVRSALKPARNRFFCERAR
jgi:hypothetical protein